jgi:hypothetical protein
MPVIGKVLEMGGVVMIDRKNASSAIEAMQPLVEAMREEGRSVALAPEGTRSVSPNLGPFKKGAFHLAMQAGVPMVPVVIHNAGDVAPKGDFVFRPATVEVDVLPPVDTSDWTPETIDEHVREVRNMFLRTLGQPEEPAPAEAGSEAQGRGHKKAHAPEEENHGHGTQGDGGFRGDNGAQGRRLATEVRREKAKDPRQRPGPRPAPRLGQSPPRGDPAAGRQRRRTIR